jgi:Na+/serine symporter
MGNFNPKLNASGCKDPTAYAAVQKVSKEEKELLAKVSEVIKVLKVIIKFANFELVERIVLRDRKTGKEFR